LEGDITVLQKSQNATHLQRLDLSFSPSRRRMMSHFAALALAEIDVK
jgi:hypothetical protein